MKYIVKGDTPGLHDLARTLGYPVLDEYDLEVTAHRDLLCHLVGEDFGLPVGSYTPWLRRNYMGMFGHRWEVVVGGPNTCGFAAWRGLTHVPTNIDDPRVILQKHAANKLAAASLGMSFADWRNPLTMHRALGVAG